LRAATSAPNTILTAHDVTTFGPFPISTVAFGAIPTSTTAAGIATSIGATTHHTALGTASLASASEAATATTSAIATATCGPA